MYRSPSDSYWKKAKTAQTSRIHEPLSGIMASNFTYISSKTLKLHRCWPTDLAVPGLNPLRGGDARSLSLN